MKIDNNSFTSTIFQEIWKKHFTSTKPILKFHFIEGVNFYKTSLKCVLFNIGKNLTKGNYYTIKNAEDYKGKVFIIYDVPSHTKMPNHFEDVNKLKLYKANQYPGFLIELGKYANVEAYIQATFSSQTGTKLRRYTKRLEICFDISTKMFYGDIDRKEYAALFEDFMGLLKRRFSDKQVVNNNMRPSEWMFYKEVAYPLILAKKASLFVLYDNNVPIAISYNYNFDNTLVEAITVFDIDYMKFNIGFIKNLKLLSWCYDNNIKKLDFSKGYFDYKKRMCSLEYNFEYHILYDNKSIKARILAFLYYNFYEVKFFLRKKGINTTFHILTYFISNGNKKTQKVNPEIDTLESLPNNGLTKIDYKVANYSFLKSPVYDFLYLTEKHKNDVDVYKIDGKKDSYIISCETLTQQVTFIK